MTTAALPELHRPSWLGHAVWPFPLRRLQRGDEHIAVTDVGSGPTLLLVHVGTWSLLWRDTISRLAADYRCVTLDPPGAGLSSRPPTTRLTLDHAAAAVAAVVDALDLDRFTLVVHDLGGPAGLAAVARRPGRVAGLAAVNTFGWRPEGPTFRGMLRLMGSAPMRVLDAGTRWLPALSSTSWGAGRRWDHATRRAFRRGFDTGAFHRYMHDAVRANDLFDVVGQALSGPLADRPLLTVFGERNDPMRFQARWRALYPGCEQQVVPHGLHFPMCDDPDLLADRINDWHRRMVRRP